jgi:Adenylylsulfate kinase and related kinases
VNFTGIDSPYEPPENAELTIDGAAGDPAAAVERIIEQLRRLGIIAA